MRATSIFTLSLLASALALPGAAHALGLGTLTVDSALGQPLSAKIALTSATRDEIDTLKARIAAPALYSQNNLNYQAALARARVTVETGPDGQSYLRVTSPGSVLEPYLDLLVEVDWSAGRVVRDYTLLLDPPGTGTQLAEPVPPRVAVPRLARRVPRRQRRLRAPRPRRLQQLYRPRAKAIRSSAATRSPRSPTKRSPRTQRSTRCWWHCSRPTVRRSSATT